MKRIYKILVALGLSVSLILLPVETGQEARGAGYPTIDLSNLVQNILKYLSDAEANGILSLGQSFDFTKFQEGIRKIGELAQLGITAVQIGRDVKEIVEITTDMVGEYELLKEMVTYFVTSGCPYSFYEAAQQCYNDFFVFSEETIKMAKQTYDFIVANQSGEDVLDVMEAVETTLNKLKFSYASVVSTTHYRMLGIYRQDVYRRQHQEDAAFLGMFII